MTAANLPSNIPNPDPSVVANERLEEAKVALRREMAANRDETKGWVEALQKLHEREIKKGDELLEEKIRGAEDKTANLDRVVQTRLAGSETALNAAMAAADKVTQEIKLNIGAVLNELKAGMTKQIESLNEKIDDIKERLNRVETLNQGSNSNRAESKDQATLELHRSQNRIATIAMAVGVGSGLIALGGILYTATRPVPPVVYSQPDSRPQLQRQIFPLVPTWKSDIYRVVE